MRERQIKERRAGEALRAGRTRWMLKMSDGITRQRQRERGTREGWRKTKRTKCIGEKNKDGERGERERERKINTVRAMCVGVVLHVYKPAAYLALLFPKKSVAHTYTHMCAL